MTALPNHVVKSLKDLKKVDYSKWERRSKDRDAPKDQRDAAWEVLHPRPHITKPRQKKVIEGKPSQKTRPATGFKESKTLPSGQSWRRRSDAVDQLDPASLRRKDNIKTLKMLICARQRAIEELEKHCSTLQLSNALAASHIRDIDSQSVTSAQDLLIRYEKLGSSIAAFNGWSHSQISQAQGELREVENHGNTLVQGLQNQLTGVKSKLLRAQAELHTLKTYKDKEYPVKALLIADMKREIIKLKDAQQDEQEDVSVLCQTEMLNLQRQTKRSEDEVLRAVAKKRMLNVPSVVKVMATHNSTMKKELEIHKQEIALLESSTSSLLQSVQELQNSPSSRRLLFPHLFPSADRCLPDTDVSLNIPQEKWLPI
ncbi:uncharacterized protein C20orf96 homolog isoform X2 [Osmerus eperlanus]|uniref:uncharacterized protein C20orf96 homolog isoform X2 n=1 Tax=Osmerus eperlanus TaxID=29151 RepID=UPI002E12D487